MLRTPSLFQRECPKLINRSGQVYRVELSASLLYEVTGGNLVDGLPPAAHTDARDIGAAAARNISMVTRWLFLIFSAALYQIVMRLSSTRDINGILISAKRRVDPITWRGAEPRQSSSCWRIFS